MTGRVQFRMTRNGAHTLLTSFLCQRCILLPKDFHHKRDHVMSTLLGRGKPIFQRGIEVTHMEVHCTLSRWVRVAFVSPSDAGVVERRLPAYLSRAEFEPRSSGDWSSIQRG